jgi:hypothetical protein
MSARLFGNGLGQVLDRYHISTVINMRGGSQENRFYREELAECARHGVAHIDIPFSARFLPPPKRLDALFTAFDSGSYPMLFHCAGGSDRSGLAATIYLSEYRHVPLDEAERTELTWRYGHIAWGQAHAMNDFFNLYRNTSGGMSLREWVRTRYPGYYARSPLAMRGSAPDMSPARPAGSHSAAGRALTHASGG